MNESDILTRSIKDYFSSDILKIAILPFVVTSIIIYTIFFNLASYGLDHFNEIKIEQQSYINGNQVDAINEDKTFLSSAISYIFRSAAIAWIVNFLVYALGSFAMIYLSIFISLIVIGFLTPYILSKIKLKHYPTIDLQGNISIFGTMFFMLKTILIMIILFIVLIPFYFIPIFNLFAIHLPFYYLFHKFLNFDVASTILPSNQINKFKNRYTTKLRLRTLLLYLLSLIPFASLILPVFYVVYIGHGYFNFLQLEHK